MSENVLISLFIVLIGAIGALFALAIKHMVDCRDFREKVAGMNTKLDTVIHEIGDHDTGIRGSLHKLRSEISPLVIEFDRRKDR